MELVDTKTIRRLRARDVSGQKTTTINDVQTDATVGELVEGLLAQLKLPHSNGVRYHVRLEREGRRLHTSERIGDALQDDDAITLQPDIHAG